MATKREIKEAREEYDNIYFDLCAAEGEVSRLERELEKAERKLKEMECDD